METKRTANPCSGVSWWRLLRRLDVRSRRSASVRGSELRPLKPAERFFMFRKLRNTIFRISPLRPSLIKNLVVCQQSNVLFCIQQKQHKELRKTFACYYALKVATKTLQSIGVWLVGNTGSSPLCLRLNFDESDSIIFPPPKKNYTNNIEWRWWCRK